MDLALHASLYRHKYTLRAFAFAGAPVDFAFAGEFGDAEVELPESVSKEHAHNGLASARQDGRVPRPLEPCLRGLCAEQPVVKVPISEIGESGKTATPTDTLERIPSGQLTIWYPPKSGSNRPFGLIPTLTAGC